MQMKTRAYTSIAVLLSKATLQPIIKCRMAVLTKPNWNKVLRPKCSVVLRDAKEANKANPASMQLAALGVTPLVFDKARCVLTFSCKRTIGNPVQTVRTIKMQLTQLDLRTFSFVM